MPPSSDEVSHHTSKRRPFFQQCGWRCQHGVSAGGWFQSFLRAIGLKLCANAKFRVTCVCSFPCFSDVHRKEKPKAVLTRCRLLAVARMNVHLAPLLITIALIAVNVKEVIIGPQISTLARYGLQLASKLHELSIIASLMSVIAHEVRSQLTQNGISFGLLTSPYSFQNLSILASQGFWSQGLLQSPMLPKFRIFFLVLVCCVLASVVGPASALLFLPSESWISTGSTDMLLAGTESQLWPQNLTAADIGPTNCSSISPLLLHTCLHGGYPLMRNIITREGHLAATEWTAFFKDALRPRTMRGIYPNIQKEGNAYEQWAYMPHAATLLHARDFGFKHDVTWEYVSPMKRRLKAGLEMMRNSGQIPAARTLCGPLRQITNDTTTLAFPVLQSDSYWRTSNARSSKDLQDGPLKEFLVPIPTLSTAQNISTMWISPQSELGDVTAAFAFFNGNGTHAVAFGCSVDARWVKGGSTTNDAVNLNVWEAYIGHLALPQNGRFPKPEYTAFLEPEVKKYLSKTILADQTWLDAISPLLHTSSGPDRLTQSTMDSLLTETKLNSIQGFIDKKTTRQMVKFLESAITIYFVDVLSRVGWHLQYSPSVFDIESVNMTGLPGIRPELQIGYSESNKIMLGKRIYTTPTNISTVSVKQEWFNYATAWRINQSSLWISLAILGTHLLIAIMHVAIMVIGGVSSEAWDNIVELVALAYNSTPYKNGSQLKNCGAGIKLRKTLEKTVKVTAVVPKGGVRTAQHEELQLLFCDDDAELASFECIKAVEAGKKYA